MLRAGCAMLLVAVLASGQQLQEQVITVNVDLVNIYFTVCNKRGRLITNLDRGNFRAFEDGEAQTITHFSKETDAPLTILLLIDTSGSVRDKLKFEQQAGRGVSCGDPATRPRQGGGVHLRSCHRDATGFHR